MSGIRSTFAKHWCAALGLAIAMASGGAGAETVIRFGHYATPGDTPGQAAERFKQLVEERTGGEVVIQIHPAYELGNDPTMLRGTRLGTQDMTVVGNPFFTSFAPEMNALDLPFLFRSYDHAYEVLDGEIGRQLLDQLEQHDLKGLALWEVGFRNLTNSVRPIREPEDLDGLKIRTTPNPAHVHAFTLLGANPTPMPFPEVYPALQTGTVDGQENPVVLIWKVRLYEVQDHLSLTQHAYTAAPLVMNLAAFNALPEEHQQVVLGAALEAAAYERELNRSLEGQAMEEIKAAGVEVVEEPDRDAFREVVAAETRKLYTDQFGPELVDAIDAAAD
jgi:tripartite ATP-independent transporter DctP family solute receptor